MEASPPRDATRDLSSAAQKVDGIGPSLNEGIKGAVGWRLPFRGRRSNADYGGVASSGFRPRREDCSPQERHRQSPRCKIYSARKFFQRLKPDTLNRFSEWRQKAAQRVQQRFQQLNDEERQELSNRLKVAARFSKDGSESDQGPLRQDSDYGRLHLGDQPE